MPRKYEQIIELGSQKLKQITGSPTEYMAFLTSAANHFKYSFRDQVLIYAQKPEATACAEMQFWNARGRWVNRCAKGIALLVDNGMSYRLRYVFDVSDTNSQTGGTVPIWQMEERYEPAVKERLENIFGEIPDTTDFVGCLLYVASMVTEDRVQPYLAQLHQVKNGSMLEELDGQNLEQRLKNLLRSSVAYTLLSRCGQDANAYFVPNEFEGIVEFDTPETASVLGTAASDTAEMVLREISTTVLALQKEEQKVDRTFAGPANSRYDVRDRFTRERRSEYGSDVQDRGRVSTAEPGRARTAAGRKIWNAAAQLPPRSQERDLHRDTAVGEVGPSSNGDRPAGKRFDGPSDRTDGPETGRDGELESLRSAEVGGPDEQHQGIRGGDRDERTDLQLRAHPDIYWQAVGPTGLRFSHHDFRVRSEIPYYYEDEEKNELLRISDALKKHRVEIAAFFAEHEDSMERGDFIKSFFDDTYVEKILSNGQRAGYCAWDDVLTLWRGSYLTREKEVFLRWGEVANTIYGMMLMEQWLDPDEAALPSVGEQLSLIEQAETEKVSAFYLPQAAIDYVLCTGNERKYRIYEQYQKRQSKQENIKFLKSAYGIGGYSHAIPGSSLFADYDSKGIRLWRGKPDTPERVEVLLPWPKIEKRIGELIALDRYLSPSEMERYLSRKAEAAMGKARELINAYCMEVFGEEADFSDLSHVPLAFSSTGDGTHTIEVSADLTAYRLIYEVAGEVAVTLQCHDMDDLNEHLANLDFDEMVAYAEGQYGQKLLRSQPPDSTDRVDEMPQQAMLAEVLYEKTGQLVFDFDQGQMEPVNAPVTKQAEKKKESGVEKFAGYLADEEYLAILRYPNGKYYNHYGYDEETDFSNSTVGGFDTFEEAERTLYAHRRSAKKIIEPEKSSTPPMPPQEVSPPGPHSENPTVQRHDYRITDDALGVGKPSERFANNVAAIQLLKTLETENRLATPEEQEVLSRYVGWGGLADYFDERHTGYEELRSLLTADEYAAARESTLTAFYTPPVVIRAMYQVLQNLGFQRGNILEPSCGIGNFIGMKPEARADSKLYGVELDPISGCIARQLYQNASITVQGFETTDLPDSFFDVAIGNVPFGNFKVSDKRYNKHNFLIHDYFFAKMLDKVRPGGIVAFVTSKGTMDKETANVRKYIAQRADLLGAIRLPNDTFKSAAGTEVTSDILFLQKRDSLTTEEPDWVHLGINENGLKMNQYFIDHPDMVLGELREVSGPYGPDTACLPYEGQSLSELLAAAVENIHGRISEYEMDDPGPGEDRSIPADPEVRNFSYTVVDGQLYYRENSRMNPVDVPVTMASRIKDMIQLRDCVRTLIEYQTEDHPNADIESEQRNLNRLYDAFVKKYGRINSRANRSAFDSDSSYFLLSSLEVLDDEGIFVRKADMFSKRTIRQRVEITSVDTASEALAVSLAEKARVDLSYMESLTGKSEDELTGDLKGVIFLEPVSRQWQTADEYLSGNVRKKLAEAKQAAETDPTFQINVQTLEAVQPTDLTPGEIAVRLGATWVPVDVVQQFMYELLDTPFCLRDKIQPCFFEMTGQWNVTGKTINRSNVKANSTYGTKRVNAYEIIEDTLNLRDVRVFDYHTDSSGKRVAVLNKNETAIAQGKQELIKQAFQDWIWKDPARRERLCKLYNEKFNNVRPREYDGSHIKFVGMNPEITLRPHQINAIARILYGGNTLLAHVVGAGKTFEMVAAAQESKRLGLCQKSMFVVPNHLTEQWAAEYLQLYPSANILVSTKKDFAAKNRKRFCSRIATGDYDSVIIGHSQFEKIPISVARQRCLLEAELEEIMDGIEKLKAAKGERFSIKQMERSRKSVQAKLDRLNDQSRKDDVVTFEELGIDRLFVDEAHYYKNLAAYTKMRNVGGISQTEAQKSSDLYMKCRYLDEITGGKGIIFATGTPISNTMVEMYTLQKYLQYETLKEHGLLNFDAWASTFGETVTAMELAPEGNGYRAKTRFARFYNLPELLAMFKEVADVQTAETLNLPVPKANHHTVVLKPSEIQKRMVAELGDRADRVRNKMVDNTVDNMLLITNDGRKLALDQRMMNPMLPDSDTSKVNACANDVFDIWQRTAEQRSTQMVFCDLSTPGKERPIEMAQNEEGVFTMTPFQNVYDDLRDKLQKKGIPRDEIAYIHDANTEVKKKELFGKVRSGKVRVLLGSTQKMGAGTNVQNKLKAMHNLDCPWRPSDLQQREGRIVRQGNENPEVDIYTYVTEDTFDAYLYQLVESKQKFIGQIMTSKSPARTIEDIDDISLVYAEIKALCAGDPRIKEKMDLEVEVQKLNLLKSSHLSQKYALEDAIIKEYPKEISALEQQIQGYAADIDHLEMNTKQNEDGFSPMEIEGTVYTDKKSAGSAILAACQAMTSPDPVPLGQYRGFAMELFFESFSMEYRITLKNTLRHTVALGADIFGNIQRIDNVLNAFASEQDKCKIHLENVRIQLANAKAEVDKPFPQEDELAEKTARLNELNILLNLDKQESEIVEEVKEKNGVSEKKDVERSR